GEKNGRKRMATVGAVYDLAPAPRRPADVIRHGDLDGTERTERPRAQAKWLTPPPSNATLRRPSARCSTMPSADPDREREWVMLVDGARHQLDLIHDQCDACGLEVRLLIHFVHVLEYAWGAAWCFFAKTDPAAESWVGERAEILHGRAEQVADDLAPTISKRTRTRRNWTASGAWGVDKAVCYLRAKLPYLGCDIALAEGWPIATGVIEGACRHLVKDRMDITGARWGLAGAEAVRRLRTVIRNGDFEEYWKYHAQREHLRVHAIRYRDSLALAA
ncbi:ISKra4 family transposase, partial [Streptomyces sp. NPDC006265]